MFLLIVFIGVPQFTEKIASFPDGIFNPPPFFSYFFSQMPSLFYFQITDLIILTGFFFTLIGLFTSISGFISAIICITNFGFIFSTGKIDHHFIVWFTLFMMSFSGWGKEFSLDAIFFNTKKIEIKIWPISFMSLALGFAFFTSGLIKLISGWLEGSSSMVRAFFLRNFYIQQKKEYLATYFENFNNSLFWYIGDWFTVLFEIGFFLVVFYPVLFRFFTLIANCFHGCVMLIMNISFHSFMPVYFLFWVPLIPKRLINRIKIIFFELKENKPRLAIIIIVILFVYILRIFFNNSVSILSKDILLFFVFILSLYFLVFNPRFVFTKPKEDQEKSVIQFDGICNLCNYFVQFIIKRDKKAYYKFSTLQKLYKEQTEFQTVILKKEKKLYNKSTAFLEIVRKLDWFWPYLYLMILIPRPIRDYIYSIVAKNRYYWFGKRGICMIPTTEIKNRFI